MNIYETMQTLMCKNEKETKDFMVDFLTPYYQADNIISTNDYVLCKGSIDIALIVHLDTVKENNRKNAKLYYDEKQFTMFCPGHPGFDDKSGLLILMMLIEQNYRPHIILTTGEETGGLGSYQLIDDFPDCPFNNVKYLLQIDRKGKQEFVTYDCENPEFDKYISSFGWDKKIGTFSDISILAPVWGCAACNVSAAYVNEHTAAETLHINWLIEIVNRITYMLEDTHNVPQFKYILSARRYGWTANSDFVKCEVCDKLHSILETDWVTVGSLQTQIAMCLDCQRILRTKKCNKCKEVYWDPDYTGDCPVCKEAKNH